MTWNLVVAHVMGQILNQSKEMLDIVNCPWMSPFVDMMYFMFLNGM